jgi:hypothetical protein
MDNWPSSFVSSYCYNVSDITKNSTGNYTVTLKQTGTSGMLFGFATCNANMSGVTGLQPIFYQQSYSIGTPTTISFTSTSGASNALTSYSFNFIIYGWIA